MSNVEGFRTRLRFEDLEGRALPDATMPAPPVAAAATTANVEANAPASPQVAATVGVLARYSVVVIRNSSDRAVSYRIDWGGTTTWTTVQPGKERVHWIQLPNRVAHILYDKSFAAGFQEQKYNLPANNFATTSGKAPPASAGKVYSFFVRPDGSGIQLYA